MGARTRFALVAALAVVATAALLGSRERTDEGASPDARVASDERPDGAPAPVLRPRDGARAARSEPERLPTRPGEVRVRGKVVDGERPVAGATVEALWDGAVVGERARTGADGAFALAVVLPPDWRAAAHVRAHDAASGRAGYARLGPPPDSLPRPSEVDVGTISLRSTLGLDVHVETACAPRAPVVVTAAPAGWKGPSAGVARAAAGPDGACRLEGLLPGTLRVVASAEGCGRAAAIVVLPREETGPLRLTLGPERVVTVAVVDGGNGAPVERARLSVVEVHPVGPLASGYAPFSAGAGLATDGSGRARIGGLGADDVLRVFADAPGFARSEATWVRAGETSVRVEMRRLRRVEWPVVAKAIPPPPDGTVLRLARAPGHGTPVPESARMEGGVVVAEHWPPGFAGAIATAPDGSAAFLQTMEGAPQGRETWFVRPRTVEVLVRYRDGEPAAGVPIHVTNAGNNPLAPPVATDASGLARVEGLPEAQAYVAAFGSTMSTAGRPIGTVDLTRGGGRLEHTIEHECVVDLRVRLDGKPGLPKEFVVFAGFSPVTVESQDRTTGSLRVRFRPARLLAAYPLSVRARGWLDGAVDVPAPPAEGTPTRGEVDLRSAGALTVTVSGAPRHYRLELQRMDSTRGDWTWVGDSSVRNSLPDAAGVRDLRLDAAGRGTRESLEPGTYRFVEGTSGWESATLRVSAGENTEARLDLSPIGPAKGRVVVPDGESAPLASVRRVDPPVAHPHASSLRAWPPIFVADDGTFSTLVSGTHPVTFEVSHPLLRPAGSEGRATVTSPRETIALRLERGAVATVRLDPMPDRIGIHRFPVLLYRGAASGEPVRRLSAVRDGAALRFADFPAGTYTVWIDAGTDLAPVVLEDVVLGPGDTDLGTAATSPGRSVVVDVRVEAGAAVPHVQVHASSVDLPSYGRGGHSRDGEVRVRGLGPGKFLVRVEVPSRMFSLGGKPALEETVDLAHATEATVVLDLTR